MRCKAVWCRLEVMHASHQRWFLIPVRVLVVTFVITLLSFAVSLLLGIGGVLLAAWFRGVHPNMAIAYWYVAVPAAATVAGIVLISASIMEVRHHRQTNVLERIERSG